jgi:RNA polymerase sigma factor (sigma-70 family)
MRVVTHSLVFEDAIVTPHSPHSMLAPLRRLIAEERRRQTTDGDLLQAFAHHGAADAFAELLHRHGPMVWRLALHLLRHRQDAEDVFQAAFLTLARKAHSLRKTASLAAWLHRITWRLAVRSRAASAQRRRLSPSLHPSEERDPAAEISARESQALLHQELNALPEHLRLPLVLCYLQGQTRDEAAGRLGWSLGTFKRRLERGRKLLHTRLSRRGLTLSAALSMTLLAPTDVPASLTAGALRLAASAATVPSSVAVLLAAAGVLSVKGKTAWTVALALAALVGSGAWLYHGREGEPTTLPASRPPSDPPAAAKINEARRPARDPFGDPLPAGVVARLGTVRLRHADYLCAIGFTVDGKTVISVGCDGVRLWEAATGRPLRHFGAGVLPWSISLSADGRRVALSRHHAGVGGPVEIWDATTGKLIHRLGNRHYSLVRFSPDGKQLAALAGEHTPGSANFAWNIDIWDVETGRDIRTLTGPKEYVSDMAYSPDGKTLLLGVFGKAISVRNVVDGKEVRRLRDLPTDVHTLALSPRGDRIAFTEFWLKQNAPGSISYGPGTRVFLVNPRTGAELRRWTLPAKMTSEGTSEKGWWWGVAFSPDGRKLAAWEKDGPIRVWDTETGEETRLLTDGLTHAGRAAFSPDGKTLAVGDGGRVIRLLDITSGTERVTTKGHRGGVTALAAAPDGRTVFTATNEGMIHRWDGRTGRELGRLAGHKDEVSSLTLSADGRRLCSVGHDKTLRVWDLHSGKDRRLLENSIVYWARLTLSPDGKTLAVPVNYKELLLFNLITGERLHRLTTKADIIAVAFEADTSVVMALTGDRAICRWEMAKGRRLPDLSLPHDPDVPAESSARLDGEIQILSSDGRLVAHAYGDKFLRVLDVSTQREMYRTAKLPGKVAALTFAADGRALAWAEDSGVIHWLELANWSERRKLPGHAGAVKQMVFSAADRLLISGSDDTTGLVWDLLGHGSATLSAERLAACWNDLADKDAAKAHRAMRSLIAAPANTLTYLRPRLKSAEGVDAKRIERWIVDLDAEAFAVREKATGELRKLGELAEPAYRKTLASRPTLEMSRRLRALLDEVSQRQWHPTPEILRQVRAIEVLERIDTPEARELLESLSRGAVGARLTREARAAVHRHPSARTH